MKNKKRICLDCPADISDFHFNQKRCPSCAEALRRRPIGKLTTDQEELIRELAGSMFIHDLIELVGVGKSTLTRWARDNKDVNLNHLRYRDGVVDAVCAYYEKHGKVKTKKKFPDVCLRSIVERHPERFKPRQIRWQDSEVIELAKLAAFVPFPKQAEYFARPGAHSGSIDSAWSKKFSCAPAQLHGVVYSKARYFIKDGCPMIKMPYMDSRRDKNRTNAGCGSRRIIVLWVEAERHIREDCPGFIADTIRSMAEFQRWLYGDDPLTEICSIMCAFDEVENWEGDRMLLFESTWKHFNNYCKGAENGPKKAGGRPRVYGGAGQKGQYAGS